MILQAIDHVQVAIPRRGEGAARIFYGDLLGLAEQEKPRNLADRGGCWFEGGDVRVHCGVEEPFHPSHKAHIAFRVDDVGELARRARDRGFEVVEDEALAGHERIYIFDPFGNRLEFLRPISQLRAVTAAPNESA
ncbi:MAG TPA: VOC family protein [Caulobacteraceae bacterium]|nr:VOC family protein [Caulobacteraceae bacterium]